MKGNPHFSNILNEISEIWKKKYNEVHCPTLDKKKMFAPNECIQKAITTISKFQFNLVTDRAQSPTKEKSPQPDQNPISATVAETATWGSRATFWPSLGPTYHHRGT